MARTNRRATRTRTVYLAHDGDLVMPWVNVGTSARNIVFIMCGEYARRVFGFIPKVDTPVRLRVTLTPAALGATGPRGAPVLYLRSIPSDYPEGDYVQVQLGPRSRAIKSLTLTETRRLFGVVPKPGQRMALRATFERVR